MKDYEKQNPTEQNENDQIKEIDPDYLAGGADVEAPKEAEVLAPQPPHNCDKFSPKNGEEGGQRNCKNCVHSKNFSDTFCEFITIS